MHSITYASTASMLILLVKHVRRYNVILCGYTLCILSSMISYEVSTHVEYKIYYSQQNTFKSAGPNDST
jgi:hypothetical protein